MPHAAIPGARPLDSLDRLRARTKMMVEDYDLTADATPTRPTFRTQFSLADENGNPAPGDKIQIWASRPVTISVGGKSFNLPTVPQGAPAFSANEMGLVSATYSGDEITAPFLFAKTDSVEDFGTVPDFEVLNVLSGLQGEGLAPTAAQGYDGQPLLPARFQDSVSRDAIASVVRNTIGRVPQGAQMTTAFLAGGSMASFSAQPGRGVSPNDILHWSLGIGDDLTFTPSDTELITRTQGELVNFNLLGSLKEFIRDVINGAKQLARVVTMWVEDAVTFICEVADGFYMFVVKTIDDAVMVLRGIFKAIVVFAERVIEWLSFLFQWKDILRTQGAIADLIKSSFDTFRRTVDAQLTNGARDVRAFFQAREMDVEKLFGQVGAQNGDTFASASRGSVAENPFAAGGQDSSVQVNWLMERAMTGTPGSGVSFSLSALPANDGLWRRIEQFGDSSRAILAANPETMDLAARVDGLLQKLGRLVRGFPNFTALGASDLLGIFGDIAVLAMKAADFLIEGLLQLLRDLIDDLETTLTGPVPIPFVSDLFKALTKRELTFVELGAFLVAVPTTILYKALFGRAPVDESATAFAALSTPNWGPLAVSVALVAKSLVEPIFDTGVFAGAAATIAGAVNLAVGVSVFGLKTALALIASPNNILSPEDGLILSLNLFPLAVGTGFVLASVEERMLAAPILPVFLTAYGLLLALLHTALAGLGLAGVQDLQKYEKNFLANLTGDIPSIGKVLVRVVVDGVQVGRIAVVGLDYVGNFLSGVFFRLQWKRGASSLIATA